MTVWVDGNFFILVQKQKGRMFYLYRFLLLIQFSAKIRKRRDVRVDNHELKLNISPGQLLKLKIRENAVIYTKKA